MPLRTAVNADFVHYDTDVILDETKHFAVGFPDGRVERFPTELKMLARISTSDGISIRGVYGEGGFDRISIFAQATRPRTIPIGDFGSKFFSSSASVRNVIFHEIGIGSHLAAAERRWLMHLQNCLDSRHAVTRRSGFQQMVASTVLCLMMIGDAQSSQPDFASLSDAVLRGGIVARGRIRERTDVFQLNTRQICGYVYVIEPKEILAGVPASEDGFSVFSRLNHDIDDRSADYLVIANGWDVGRDVPMAQLARSIAKPGDNFCAPQRADYILDKSRESMLPFRSLPEIDGEWLEEQRSSPLSNATLVRMIRVRHDTDVRLYYMWEDVGRLVRAIQE